MSINTSNNTNNNTIHSILKNAVAKLSSISDAARLDAELLLSHTIKKDRSYLFTWPDALVEGSRFEAFQQLLQKRVDGTPIAYLLGYREFWTLILKVTPDTLIPRPETELLVEVALDKIPNDKSMSILDLGTGTGAIALSIGSERPQCQVLAVDVSPKALTVAKQNAIDNQISNVEFLQSSWFDDIPVQQFDLILSNPPYIEDDDKHLDQGDVRYEPRLALTSGADGFGDIRHIIQKCAPYLKGEGWLMFEHGYQQAKKSRELLQQAGFSEVLSLRDLSENERVSFGQLICPSST